ncbi:MAG: hypothetical protein U0521_29505 [Anaerolineae bacterium]
MLPMFDDTQSGRTPQTLALKVFAASLAAIFAGALAMMLDTGIAETPVVMLFFVIAALGIAGSVLALMYFRMSKPKTKRGLEGLDLYSVIDRLVDDLDDDEAAYLQRRLDERDAKTKNDLTVSLDELLDQRARNRASED